MIYKKKENMRGGGGKEGERKRARERKNAGEGDECWVAMGGEEKERWRECAKGEEMYDKRKKRREDGDGGRR